MAVVTSQATNDNPLAGFGPNEWIVEDMYQQYLADPSSVDPAWHDFFADYRPADGRGDSGQDGGSPVLTARAAAPVTAPASPAPAPAAAAAPPRESVAEPRREAT